MGFGFPAAAAAHGKHSFAMNQYIVILCVQLWRQKVLGLLNEWVQGLWTQNAGLSWPSQGKSSGFLLLLVLLLADMGMQSMRDLHLRFKPPP